MGGRVVRIITRLNRGGPLRQLTALVPGLVQQGWSGPIIAGSVGPGEHDGSDALRAVGANLLTVPSLRRGVEVPRDARALRAILAVLRREQPDLVHTHMGKAGALGRLAAAMVGVPCVHTFHGHHFSAPWPRGHLAVEAERRLGRLTRAGIVLTERQRRDVVDVHGVMPNERVAVILPGLDIESWRARARDGDAEGVRARLAPAGEVLYLWAGRFVEVKRPQLLVDAVAASAVPYRVVMLGDGPLRMATRNRVRAAGLEERILLPGDVADVAPWMQAADAVVLTSASEGAPLALLEAKALGRAAVVTTVGGVPDLVEHLEDGLWVPPDDAAALAGALDRLAADTRLRARLGLGAGVKVRARYGADRLARETADLYERLRARPVLRRWRRPAAPECRGAGTIGADERFP